MPGGALDNDERTVGWAYLGLTKKLLDAADSPLAGSRMHFDSFESFRTVAAIP